MNNYKLKVKEDKVSPNSFYLIELKIEDSTYLLCRGKSLMVWETLEGLQQSLIRTGGTFLDLYPWPIRITKEQFPSIEDLDFNPIVLELSGKEYISEVPFIDMKGITLIPTDESKVSKYRMTAQ